MALPNDPNDPTDREPLLKSDFPKETSGVVGLSKDRIRDTLDSVSENVERRDENGLTEGERTDIDAAFDDFNIWNFEKFLSERPHFQNVRVLEKALEWRRDGAVSRYLDHFDVLPDSAFWMLVNSWHASSALRNFAKFRNPPVVLDDDFADFLVEEGELALIRWNLKIFQPLSLRFAFAFFEKKKFDDGMSVALSCRDFDSNTVASKLLDTGGRKVFASRMDSFSKLDPSIAKRYLLESTSDVTVGDMQQILYNSHRFEGLEKRSFVTDLLCPADVLMDSETPYSQFLEYVDSKTAIKKAVLYQTENFLNNEDKAQAFIDSGMTDIFKFSISYFGRLNPEHSAIAVSVIGPFVPNPHQDLLVSALPHLSWLGDDVAYELIARWKGESVTENLPSFWTATVLMAYLERFPTPILSVFDRFSSAYLGDAADVERFSMKIREVLDSLIAGTEPDASDLGIPLDELALLVYPKRNYSPENLSGYEDESADLNGYAYDRSGYRFPLDRFLGYDLAEGQSPDEPLLAEYEERVRTIRDATANGASLAAMADEFAKRSGITLDSKHAETKILEYFFQKKARGMCVSAQDADLFVASRLLGRFEEFVRGSNDKADVSEDPVTVHAVKIHALLREYGDVMKDEVRSLDKWVKENALKGASDAVALISKYSVSANTPFKVLSWSKFVQWLIKSFASRPPESITDDIVRKSVRTKCLAALQGLDIGESAIEAFVGYFGSGDFQNLSDEEGRRGCVEKWESRVASSFPNSQSVSFDLSGPYRAQSLAYSALRTEGEKFEEVVDASAGKSERNVFARFWKTRFDALARGVADVCLWGDETMWENPSYFELVLFDTDRKKNVGTVMLLIMEEPDGKNYLLFNPNPSVEFDEKVSSPKLLKKLSDIVIGFAADNGFDGVLFDSEHGKSTNRAGNFQSALEDARLLDESEKPISVDLKGSYRLWSYEWADSDYVYSSGLSCLWKRHEE